jgi:hypothetical protein
MPQSSPTPQTSTPVRRSRLATADRPLSDALHVKPGADLRWQRRRDHGLSDAELRAAMAEEGPYDGLISDATLARVRRVLKIPFPAEPPAPPPESQPVTSADAAAPPPLPPGAGRRTTRTTTPSTHPPPFLEIHRRVFTPPTPLGAELWGLFCVDRDHPDEAHRQPQAIRWERTEARAKGSLDVYHRVAWPCQACHHPLNAHRWEMRSGDTADTGGLSRTRVMHEPPSAHLWRDCDAGARGRLVAGGCRR